MEGTNGREVGFNGGMFEAFIGKEGDPFTDGSGGRWEEGTTGGPEGWVKSNEVEEAFLTGGIGFTSAGCETVPEVEGRASREVRVRLIPIIWDFVDEEVFSRVGLRRNSLEYWKREAASASALSVVETQTEEKEKSRQAASIEIKRMMDMELGDLEVPEDSQLTTAWLSTRKIIWQPCQQSPQRKIA